MAALTGKVVGGICLPSLSSAERSEIVESVTRFFRVER